MPDDALLLESDLPDAESVDVAMAQIGGQLPRGGHTVVVEGRLLLCMRWQNPARCARAVEAARFTLAATTIASAASDVTTGKILPATASPFLVCERLHCPRSHQATWHGSVAGPT